MRISLFITFLNVTIFCQILDVSNNLTPDNRVNTDVIKTYNYKTIIDSNIICDSLNCHWIFDTLIDTIEKDYYQFYYKVPFSITLFYDYNDSFKINVVLSYGCNIKYCTPYSYIIDSIVEDVIHPGKDINFFVYYHNKDTLDHIMPTGIFNYYQINAMNLCGRSNFQYVYPNTSIIIKNNKLFNNKNHNFINNINSYTLNGRRLIYYSKNHLYNLKSNKAINH